MAQTSEKNAAANFNNSHEAMEIISTIRALTVSQKEMTSEQDLIRDYKQLNGEMIPYRKFGFRSLEQFLMASCEFTIRRNAQGGISISAKPSKESSHIVALIQKQKSNAPSKKRRTLDFRRPLSSDQSWHKTQYSNAFAKLPSPRKSLQSIVQRNSHHRSSSNPHRNVNNNTNVVPNRNLPGPNKENLDNFQLITSQNFKVQDVRAKGREHLINEPKRVDKSPGETVSRQNSREPPSQQKASIPQTQSSREPQPKQQDVRGTKIPANNLQPSSIANKITISAAAPIKNNNHISNSNKYSNNRPNNNTSVANSKTEDSIRSKLQSRTDMANAIANHQPMPEYNKKITIQNDQPKKIPPLMSLQVTIPTHNHSAPMLKSSLQDRLIVNKPLQICDTLVSRIALSSPTITTPPTPTYSQPATPVLVSSPPVLLATPSLNMTPSEELEHYCATHKYEKPVYNTFKLQKSNRFNCKVTVNGSAYSTYPDDFLTEYEAQSLAAQNALKDLKETEATHLYPVCHESDFNVAIKIYNKLKDYEHGVFSKDFPDMFQKTYERMIPDKWFSIVVSSPQLFSVEETTLGTYILFARVRDSNSSSVSTTSDSESTSQNEKLVLPWHLDDWCLYITNPVSTIQVWARLIGEEYSEKMDSFSNDIDMAMLTENVRAQTIQIGYIYLVSVSDCWYRVRANEIDFEQNRCMCFFIDVGDEEWYSMDQLYVCDSRFMKFPAQAIAFSLFGLEDFDENPHAKQELVNLAGRTLIGKVFTKQEEYEMHEESPNFDARVKIVLYDTSSDDDLNLNPIILQKICENTPPPQFDRANVTHVNITCINDNGDVYCQIKDSGIYYIEKLINNLIESKLNEEIHSGLYQQDKKGSANQYYLIFDENDKKWYRAIIESFSNVEDEYKLFYVDYGISRTLKTKRILRTDSLSAALHRFPQQAVRVRLFGFQHMNENTVARLRGLLKIGAQAIIKVMSPASIPIAKIYIRLQPNGTLFNVSDTIQVEQEMEQTSEINQNVANLKLNLSKTTNSSKISSSSAYRSPQTIGSNSSLSSSKASSKNGGNVSLANSPDSASSLNDLSSQFKSIDLKSQSTPSGGKMDLSQIKPAVRPPIGELTYVRISMASNPNYFVIQPNKDAEKLHELMTELQTYCKNSKEFIPSDCVKVGEVYGALHADGSWYRATVENIYGPSMIHVFYCDFGDVTVLSSDKLKILPFQFRTLPRQASKAKLHGIKPKHGDWAMEDCLYFQELTINKVFAAIVKSIVEDEINKEELLELVLVDVSGETDISIHNLLITENLAIPC